MDARSETVGKHKTLMEKMDSPKSPEFVVLDKPVLGCQAGDTMLIPTPRMIEAFLDSIPVGETRTPSQMRESLAEAQGADVCCPLCSGMFLKIVSEASLAPDTGVKAPFWRVVDPKSPLAKKLPCGPDWIQAQREAEA